MVAIECSASMQLGTEVNKCEGAEMVLDYLVVAWLFVSSMHEQILFGQLGVIYELYLLVRVDIGKVNLKIGV